MSFDVGVNDETRGATPQELKKSVSFDSEQTIESPVNPLAVNASDLDSELMSTIPPLNEGERIEHFVIQRLIDRGGFGFVFAAFDEKLERVVALKIPHAREMSESQKQAFLQEARLSAKLNHPNIVSVHEVGETNGRIWIASDLIDGRSLVGYLHRNSLSEKQIATICASICSGVQAAHQMRIIHRDLKPGNILMDRNGHPYIADFGLAFRDEPSADGQAYRLAGTLPYMSPEQLDRYGAVDARSDVYAIGVILYQMLAGERPHRGSRTEIMDQILEARPKSLQSHNAKTSPEIEAVCLKAIDGNPDTRYQSAKEMEADLKRFLGGEIPLAYEPNLVDQSKRWVKKHKWPLTTAVAVLVLVAFIFLRPPAAPSVDDGLGNLPTASSEKLSVVISTNPAGASIAIVPFDRRTFNPDPSKKLQFSGKTQYIARLEPGLYLVEAVHEFGSDVLIQEVIRTVPNVANNSQKYRLGLKSRTYYLGTEENQIVWPAINIPNMQNNKDFAFVEGGMLKKRAILDRLPFDDLMVDPYRIQKLEVTVGEFEKIMLSPLEKMQSRFTPGTDLRTFAATNVSFFDALEYAERTNSRLPTFDEYSFAASNGGTTLFPWGDDETVMGKWVHDAAETPAYDITLEPTEIRGLFSRVAEWTQTGSIDFITKKLDILRPSRMIAGSAPAKNDSTNSILIVSEDMSSRGKDTLGFRCARSVTPRFFVEDDE